MDSLIPPSRAAFYVDGFNLYHAIDNLRQPHLKWLGLRRLAEIILIGRKSHLVRTAFFTAYFPGDGPKGERHRMYVRALRNQGVDVTFGQTMSYTAKCRICSEEWRTQTEKETDINMALAVYSDAVNNRYDDAYLITADTDQAATIKALKRDYPDKRVYIVPPPGRSDASLLEKICDGKVRIKEKHIDDAVMREMVPCPNGGPAAVMPLSYSPPAEWMHPDDRRSKG